jgi:superoxide dismutase, Fe-Mn family
MHTYTAHTFALPEVTGISQKQMDVHLALYQGYVKHVNLLREQIAELTALDGIKYAYAIENLRRRLGWEFNGMRNHEFYFPQFEGGPTAPTPSSIFYTMVVEKYGSWEGFVQHITTVCMTRGPGWAMVYHDVAGTTLHTAWVTEHELGAFNDARIVLALDMWEHAFMVDYMPVDKKKHVEALLSAINWSIVEKRVV